MGSYMHACIHTYVHALHVNIYIYALSIYVNINIIEGERERGRESQCYIGQSCSFDVFMPLGIRLDFNHTVICKELFKIVAHITDLPPTWPMYVLFL